jgi:hypothetical protein
MNDYNPFFIHAQDEDVKVILLFLIKLIYRSLIDCPAIIDDEILFLTGQEKG